MNTNTSASIFLNIHSVRHAIKIILRMSQIYETAKMKSSKIIHIPLYSTESTWNSQQTNITLTYNSYSCGGQKLLNS